MEVQGMMRNSTYTWDLVQAPATCIDSIRPNKKPEKSKEPRNQIQLPSNRMMLPWSTYRELSTKKGRLGTKP